MNRKTDMIIERRTRFSLGMLFCLAASSAAAQETLLWSEEFDGSGAPDPGTWTYDLGDLGVNNELQIYTDDPLNVRVAGGNLVIHARRETDGRFTSGRIKTKDKVKVVRTNLKFARQVNLCC